MVVAQIQWLSENRSLSCIQLFTNSMTNLKNIYVSRNGRNLDEVNREFEAITTFHNNLDPLIRNLLCNFAKVLNGCTIRELTNMTGAERANRSSYHPPNIIFSYGMYIEGLYNYWGTVINSATYSPLSQRFIAGFFIKMLTCLYTQRLVRDISVNGTAYREGTRHYPNLTAAHIQELNNLFATVDHGGVYDIFNSSDWSHVLSYLVYIDSINYRSLVGVSMNNTLTHIQNNCLFNGSLEYMVNNTVSDSANVKISNFFNSYREFICSQDATLPFCPIVVCAIPATATSAEVQVSASPLLRSVEAVEGPRITVVPERSNPNIITVSWTSPHAIGDAKVTTVPSAQLILSQNLTGMSGSIKYQLHPTPTESSNPNPRLITITVETKKVGGDKLTSSTTYSQPPAKRK